MSLDAKTNQILKMFVFALHISSERVVDTGKCDVFLKERILVASAENCNVKLNRKLLFSFIFFFSLKAQFFSESEKLDVSS